MIFLLDNYDSFTYNLVDYFFRNGANCIVKRNDEITVEEIERLQPKAIVLSPGPNTPNQAGILMETIAHFEHKLPIFGICLGLQAIGMHYGMQLIKANLPMHGKTSILKHKGNFLFKNITEEYEVMRYHSLVLKNETNNFLEVTSTTKDNQIMAMQHKTLPICGVQYHPESILTKNGLQLIGNWLKSF